MNLIACPGCAVVYDADLLHFPKLIEREDGSIDTNKAEWNGERYVPKVDCRVCGTAITRS